MVQWIIDHVETVLAVVAFLVAGWKARKNGVLATFLTTRINGIATPEDKAAIKAEAIEAGVQTLLHKTVVNAGLSKEKPAGLAKKALQTVLPLLLGAVLLGGCKSIEPYRLSVEGMASTGDDVRPLIKSPLTPGEQALVDAWDFQRKAGHDLAGK